MEKTMNVIIMNGNIMGIATDDVTTQFYQKQGAEIAPVQILKSQASIADKLFQIMYAANIDDYDRDNYECTIKEFLSDKLDMPVYDENNLHWRYEEGMTLLNFDDFSANFLERFPFYAKDKAEFLTVDKLVQFFMGCEMSTDCNSYTYEVISDIDVTEDELRDYINSLQFFVIPDDEDAMPKSVEIDG